MEELEIQGKTTEEVAEPETKPEGKTYTQEQFNEAMSRRLGRERANFEKEVERKYGRIERVLRAGTGKEDLDEIAQDLENLYGTENMNPTTGEDNLSDQDLQILAGHTAKEIIADGPEVVEQELERLRSAQNLTKREEALKAQLEQHLEAVRKEAELEKAGIPADVAASPEFQAFAKKFAADTPLSEVYSLYPQKPPAKEINTMGSMSSSYKDTGVKDFYTPEEARKFTKADFDKNPAIWKAVNDSMTKWGK